MSAASCHADPQCADVKPTKAAGGGMVIVHLRSAAMASGFYVRVAPDVADDLRRHGFLTRGAVRGPGEALAVAQVVLGAVGAGVALGADATTILVARHQIRRFLERVWPRARQA